MLRTFVVGGALLLAAFAGVPQSAKADTRIGVTINEGWTPSQYYPDDPDDDYDDEEDYISCGEGRQVVRDEGFRRVRAVRCGGEVYRYEAVKRYRLWSVKVSARSGRIISARVIGNYGGYY